MYYLLLYLIVFNIVLLTYLLYIVQQGCIENQF